MGIPKFTGFIAHNFQSWQSKNVRGGNLVIDGSSLCYYLYFAHYQWELGGEYCEFYSAVRDYLNDLKSLGITVYIVMDGIDFDDSKKATNERRCVQKIERMVAMQSGFGGNRTVQFSLIPLFAKSVFLDAVCDVGVNCFVADGEADQSIVSLANFLQCPVLGNDSDFYIFDIKCGYIPIVDSANSLVSLHRPVKCFQASDFDRQFSLSPEQRLYLPLILGCDISSGYQFRRLGIDSSTAVHKIISAIKQNLRSEADVGRLGSDRAVIQLDKVRAYYTVRPQSFVELSSSRSLAMAFPSIPTWILDSYKSGTFSANVLHLMLSQSKVWRYLVVVEDMRKASAWVAAENVFLYVVGLVLGEEGRRVTLVDRDGKKLVEKRAVLPRNYLQFPQLADILRTPHENKQDLVINIFRCQNISVEIKSAAVREELKLAVIVTKLWLSVDGSHRQWLKALILSLQACSKLDPPQREERYLLQGDEKLCFIHAFAQWQCILYHAIALNQALNCPFPKANASPRLFSSVAVQCYYRDPPNVDEEAQLLIDIASRS